MAPTNPANGKGTYEIRLGLWASQEQAQEISDRITELLCPEPEHDGPCEIPWSLAVVPPEAVDQGEDRYEELITQAEIEGSY